uniref:Glycosyltransferase n=1 Tax=Leersia perrieri TaxID=77586 RepID=A0A0D9VU76_9ORYZ
MATAHFVFVPLMSQGHLIPAVDTAMLLATHGAVCTVIVTPASAARVRPTVESAQRSGLRLRLAEFPLDYAGAGLPEGVDSTDDGHVPPQFMPRYFLAVSRIRDAVERHLRDAASPPPTCVVADFCHPWTSGLAAALAVPRLTFFSTCALCLLCHHNLEKFRAFDGVVGDDEPVPVPGLPPTSTSSTITVTRAQAPRFFRGVPGWEKFADDVERAWAESDGDVINTFLEMEPEFVAGYVAARGTKVWTVGPVALYHRTTATLALRGHTHNSVAGAVDADECLRWLDGKDPSSVVYVSFGSIVDLEEKQTIELGLGLESSGHPFVWVVKSPNRHGETAASFLRDLEARVAGRGLLVWGWAPQALILSHGAVGAFVTHCGWNSTMEAATAGVAVVAWPHFADQFVNAKMAVEVLRIGVGVGVEEPVVYQRVKKEIVVGRETVEAAVRSAMDGGEEGEARRRRARALSAKATAAMREGGSSHANLVDLVKRFQPRHVVESGARNGKATSQLHPSADLELEIHGH